MEDIEPTNSTVKLFLGAYSLIIIGGLIAMNSSPREAKNSRESDSFEDARPEVRYDKNLATKICKINYDTGEVEYLSDQPRTKKSRYEILINDRDILDKEALLEEIMDELDFWEMYDEYGAK